MVKSEASHVDSAVMRLKEMLRHPDDLEVKVNMLRRRLLQEKATIDAQLKSGAQRHFDNVQRGLVLLREATERSDALQRQLRAASEQRFGTRELSEHYDAITHISRIHENMSKTKRFVEQFRRLEGQLDDALEYFDRLRHAEVVAGRELLALHLRVSRLETFRDSVMRESQTVSRDTMRSLQRAFERLYVLCEDFTQYFWSTAAGLLNWAAAEDGEMIICLAKIVEAEEQADARALETWKNEQPEANPDPANGPTPKAWRDTLVETLREQVELQYTQWAERFADDPFAALDDTGFIIDDLSLVFDVVVPRFPKKYKIFPFYTLEYHQQLAKHIARIASLDLDAGQILHLLRWTREYYSNMKKQLGIVDKVLQPPLLDEHEDALIKDYLRLVRAKMDEWMANLVKAGGQDFHERSKPPEQDTDSTYGIGASVIIFQMINEQIEVATESNRGNILADVAVECAGALRTTQEAWRRMLTDELKRQTSGKEVPGGFVEYVMALANEQMRCVEFCESISERSSNMVNEKYGERIRRAMEEALSGFINVGKLGCSCLVDVVHHDLKPLIKQLFGPEWYEEDLCGTLVETLRDYCEDFRAHMKEYLCHELMLQVLNRFMFEYLKGPRNKLAVLHMPDMDDRMQEDLSRLYDFFSEFFEGDQLRDAFAPIDALRQFATAPPEEMCAEFGQLREHYPDAPLWLSEKIITKRSDLEKPQAKELIEAIKKTHGKPASDHPTIFSQMKKK